jgi:VanZ family protein
VAGQRLTQQRTVRTRDGGPGGIQSRHGTGLAVGTPTPSAHPLGLILVAVAIALLARVRVRPGTPRRTAVLGATFDVTLTASIISVSILTLPPSLHAPRTMSLVPFAELRRAVGDFGVSELLGNALMFVPFGFLAPLRWHRLDSPLRILSASTAFSIAVETLQFILPTGRQSSLTDVIMNAMGAMVGYTLMVAIRGAVRSSTEGGDSEAFPSQRVSSRWPW